MPTPWPDDLTIETQVGQMFDNAGGDQMAMATVKRTGLVNSVVFYPNWSMSGANTNSRTYTLYNRGQSGAGTAVVATLALTSGVNLSKGVSKTITLGAAADRVVAIGDVLEWQSLHVLTGLPDPGGRVVIQQTHTT